MLTFERGRKTEESWLLKRRLLAPDHIASRSMALARRSWAFAVIPKPFGASGWAGVIAFTRLS